MLSILDTVLNPQQVQAVLGRLAGEAFEDGKNTAGYRAKLVNANEQMR